MTEQTQALDKPNPANQPTTAPYTVLGRITHQSYTQPITYSAIGQGDSPEDAYLVACWELREYAHLWGWDDDLEFSFDGGVTWQIETMCEPSELVIPSAEEVDARLAQLKELGAQAQEVVVPGVLAQGE